MGEKVFTIGTQVLGGKAQRVTMMEGTVSSTDRRIDGTPVIQTTIPVNPGMVGAPLMNQERKLVGVLIGGVGELERTSIAVPASLLV